MLLNQKLQKYNIDISDTFIEVDNHIQLIFKSLWEIEKNKINFISFSIFYNDLNNNKVIKTNYIDKISLEGVTVRKYLLTCLENYKNG